LGFQECRYRRRFILFILPIFLQFKSFKWGTGRRTGGSGGTRGANFTHLRETLLEHAPLRSKQI
jgi:hypothetical protein